MTLKKLGLLTAFCLTLVLYGCGGGGGGSNPIAASADPAVDATLSTEYPAISASYSSMQTALEEVAGSTPTARVNSFMPYIASEFTNAAGAPASSSLKDVTLDRLERYTINSYRFIPTSHKLVDASTLEVTTYMFIDVVRKEGKAGAFVSYSQPIVPSPVITWKLYSDTNTWKIQKGLPYLSSEIPF